MKKDLIRYHIESIFSLALEIRDLEERHVRAFHAAEMSINYGIKNAMTLIYVEDDTYYLAHNRGQKDLKEFFKVNISQFEACVQEMTHLFEFILNPCCVNMRKGIFFGELVWRDEMNLPGWIGLEGQAWHCFWCNKALPQLDKSGFCEEYSHSGRFSIIAAR